VSGAVPTRPSPASKGHREGTDRLVGPEETLRRVSPHLPAMGITRVANITGLDRIGIPVVTVCRPNSRSLAVAQGKGGSLVAAKASGVMEAVETYHAECIDRRRRLFASHREVCRRHRVADVRRLARVPGCRFDPTRAMHWIEGHDLIAREPVWVPYEIVHTDFTLPPARGSGCFAASTNGLASGNHLLEAISHGVCEVVERDATTLWFQQSIETQNGTRIDPDSVGDRLCRDVMDRFQRADIAVAIWETTSDVGIPAFLCQIADRGRNGLRRLYGAHGMGCHPRRDVALLRALTETAQCRLSWIAGAPDDFTREQYARYCSDEALRMEHESVAVNGPMRPLADGPTWNAATLDEDVAWEIDRLRRAGIERVICVDLTKPEFGIPVVRIVIPGLESIGYGEGLRTYVPGKRARARRRQRLALEPGRSKNTAAAREASS
jgi:ribosomal protein S12 methylthiotransferase accessory factor